MPFGRSAGKLPVSGSLAAPSTVGSLPAWLIYENTGSEIYSSSAGFAGSELVYTLTAGATGVTIDASSGTLTADTFTTAIQSGTTLTVRATNGAGNADQNISLTVAIVRRQRPVLRSSAAIYRANAF
jgi:hypothetical protein